MQRFERTRRIAVPAAAVLLLALAIPALAAPAFAASPPNPSQPPEQWAYGAVHFRNVSLNASMGQYSAQAFFGWTVVYTLTNTSNTTFQLEAQRTLAVRYSATLCAPSCASPTARLAVSIHGLEQETGFANFTILGSVREGGNATPALGLIDAHSVGSATLNESLAGNRTLHGMTGAFASDVRIHAQAHADVAFNGSLGLIPWNAAPGANWTSSAAFTASGGYSIGYAWSVRGNSGNGSVNLSGTGNPSGQVNGSGHVLLAGEDLGPLALEDGTNTSVIVLVWQAGPFDGLDGVIVVPRGFEVLGGGPHAWDGHSEGVQSVATSRVDLAFDLLHHRVRIAAAASAYQGADSLNAGTAGSVSAIAPAATPSGTLVQAQPEAVPTARSNANCLATGCASGPAASTGGPAGYLLPLLVAGLAIAAVAGAVGAVEFRRIARRRAERRQMSGFAAQAMQSGVPASLYPPFPSVGLPPSPPPAAAPGNPPTPPPPPRSP